MVCLKFGFVVEYDRGIFIVFPFALTVLGLCLIGSFHLINLIML